MKILRSFIFISMFGYSIAGSELCSAHDLASSAEALESIQKINSAFKAEQYQLRTHFMDHQEDQNNHNIDTFIQRHMKLIDDYEKRSPLFLLGECTYEGFGDCCLSRLDEPHLRQGLETYVTHMINERIEHIKNRALQYVSFGAGGMFQDLIILTKTLQKHPQAHLDVHLIDTQYNIYTDICKLIGEPTCQVKSQSKQFQNILDTIVAQAQSARNNDSAETLRYELSSYYMVLERMGQQFLHYLSSRFPEARISLFLHQNSDDYLNHVQTQKKSYPDIIVAADITDEMSLLKGSNETYKRFVLAALQHNPDNINVVLDRTACGLLISYYPKSAHAHIKTTKQLRRRLMQHAVSPGRWLINSRLALYLISRRFWAVPSHSYVNCYTIPLAH